MAWALFYGHWPARIHPLSNEQAHHLWGQAKLRAWRANIYTRCAVLKLDAPHGWHHNGKTRHERGYGTAWDKLRQVVMNRDMFLCQPCKALGRLTAATEVDHITPKAKNGTNDPANLQAICGPCHKDKTARDNGARPRVTFGPDGWPV